MTVLLVLLVAAASLWVLGGLLGRGGPPSDPSVSVRGFSQALDALERAPRRRLPRGRIPSSGGRRS